MTDLAHIRFPEPPSRRKRLKVCILPLFDLPEIGLPPESVALRPAEIERATLTWAQSVIESAYFDLPADATVVAVDACASHGLVEILVCSSEWDELTRFGVPPRVLPNEELLP